MPRGEQRGCAPLGFWAPAGRRPARARTTIEATETLTEGTKSLPKPTRKHVRAVGAPLNIWVHQKKKQGHCDYQGPQWQPITIGDLSEYQEPSDNQGLLWSSGPSDYIRGPLNIRGPLIIRAPLTIRGPPNCQGPSDYQGPSHLSGISEFQGPSIGPFQAWGPSKFRHLIFHFIVMWIWAPSEK